MASRSVAPCPFPFYANTNAYGDAERVGPGFRCAWTPPYRNTSTR